jgi:hypothetical protein
LEAGAPGTLSVPSNRAIEQHLRLLPRGNCGAQHVQAQLQLIGRRHLTVQDSSLRGGHPEPAALAFSFQRLLQPPPTIV